MAEKIEIEEAPLQELDYHERVTEDVECSKALLALLGDLPLSTTFNNAMDTAREVNRLKVWLLSKQIVEE